MATSSGMAVSTTIASMSGGGGTNFAVDVFSASFPSERLVAGGSTGKPVCGFDIGQAIKTITPTAMPIETITPLNTTTGTRLDKTCLIGGTVTTRMLACLVADSSASY